MSVIIKDMNMPKSCHDCAMRYIAIGLDFECVFTYDDVGDCIERRLANCPLEEVHTPHGDLIDRDKIIQLFLPIMEFPEDERIMYVDSFIRALKNAPTIIEAEQGDG